ncbi:hypothetical protein SDC9_39539 [bioreactor metagenome]|jgi:hypothetical protein|uniref:Uncharacterized protein n=2 Tax=root TaxID=1 RepID=R9CB03_9CLOT|nr:hypothetical protein A500_07621 [Clostridium sartagoforme AAU1]
MKTNYFIRNIKVLCNKKIFIYFVRGIGWIVLPIAIHIGLFHKGVLDEYPILSLVFVLIFLLTDYKVKYKDMKTSKRVIILLSYLVACIICGYIVYIIGCKF